MRTGCVRPIESVSCSRPSLRTRRRATLSKHAGVLAATLRSLGVLERARGGLANELAARDQAAATALENLLDGLRARAADAGWDPELDRSEAAAVLGDLMGCVRLERRGARGGRVRLVRPKDLAARTFAHVFVVGLTEGSAPAGDGIFGDRERRALNQALGRRVLATAVEVDGHVERDRLETLGLLFALVAARETVTFSYPLTDGKRPVVRAPFVGELVRAAPGITVETASPSPVPSLDAAGSVTDVLARAAMGAWADPAGQLRAAARRRPS